MRRLRDRVYAEIAERVRSLGVPVIEAQIIEDEMSPGQFALNPMDSHPSEAAHRRIAEVIAAEIRSRHLLQRQ